MDDRWERIEALLDDALDLPEDRLPDWLAGLDDDLRPDVERLLRAHRASDGFLETPAAADAANLVAESGDEAPEQSIGPYRVLGEIGRGGMGAVFLAHRDDLEMDVAIKRLPHAVASRRAVSAFLAERRTLARLEHPHIARLLDAGLTESDQPYFVMERIDGRPLTRHCDEEGLGVRERLRLFLDVCGAVDYAHGRLVVHRDLKPSNVLVGRDGVPKLLDFGIAKVLDDSDSGGETRTVGHFMTPQYASPEQIRGEEIGITSDVYSLGAVLHELLAGSPPHEVSTGTPYEVGRAVLETEPPPLAEAAIRGPEGVSPEDVARCRGTTPKRLAGRLRGDLTTIVRRAMHRDPDRRYPTAAALAEDVRRHLEGRPVLARGDSWAYRSSRFVRRNWLQLGLAGAAVVTAVAFASYHGQRIAHERDEAQYQARTAHSVSEFLISVFLQSDPDRSGGEPTVRDVLARGAERVMEDVEGDPAVRARLLDALGEVQRKLGRLQEARPLLEEGLRLRREALGPRDPEVLTSMGHVAALESNSGDLEEAARMNREIYELAVEIHGKDHQEAVVRLHNLGTSLRAAGHVEEAESVLRQSLEGRRRLFGEEHVAVANATTSLANVVRDLGRYEEAEELYAESLELSRAVYGEDHVRVAMIWHNLGRMQVRTRHYDEAERSLEEALRIRRLAYGENSARLEPTIAVRASLRASQGDAAGAAVDYGTALRLLREHHGPRSGSSLEILWGLADMQERLGREETADSTHVEAVATAAEAYGEDSARWEDAVVRYADFLTRTGREEEAGTWRERARLEPR